MIQVAGYLDYVSNRVVPDDAVRQALEQLWSASAFMGTASTENELRQAAAEVLVAAGLRSSYVEAPTTRWSGWSIRSRPG
ncbi:MAG: hypothetical protein JO272_00705 [Pseudonocardiales bacterium]|nr:hypothetical protein [Pseudonocardiales bacterium]